MLLLFLGVGIFVIFANNIPFGRALFGTFGIGKTALVLIVVLAVYSFFLKKKRNRDTVSESEVCTKIITLHCITKHEISRDWKPSGSEYEQDVSKNKINKRHRR